MSILAMTSLAALRAAQNAGKVPSPIPAPGGVKTAIGQITAYIPTEVIGAYIAALGILTPESSGLRWAVFVIALVVTPIFVGVSFALRRRQTPELKQGGVGWLIAFAILSFVAWAGAIPGTPMLDIPGWTTVIGGIAVIFLAPLLSKLAEWLELSPKT